MALKKKTPPRLPNPNSGAIPRPPHRPLRIDRGEGTVRRGGAASSVGKRPSSQFLERAEFAVLMAMTMIAIGLVNRFGPEQIADAKAAGDGVRWWIANAFLILANLGAFWYSMRLCVRRYRDLVGDPRISIWTQGWIRAALLSPIFSAQLIIVLLLFEGAKSGTKLAPSGSSKLMVFILSTLLGHAVWLGSCLHFHAITWDQAAFRFRPHVETSSEIAPLQRDLNRASVLEPYRDIHDLVLVHVLPYLNITLHAAAMTAKDFDRAYSLYTLTIDKNSMYCRKPRSYHGIDVDDCYWSTFLALNNGEKFVTPWAPLMLSMKWKSDRQQQGMGSITDPNRQISPEEASRQLNNARQSLAGAVLMLENAVSVFENGIPKRTISEATSPHGLLPFIGNVELPVISLLQEMQKLFLAKTISGKIRGQLPEIRQGLAAAGEVFGSGVQAALITRLDTLDSRLQSLEDQHIFSKEIWSHGAVH